MQKDGFNSRIGALMAFVGSAVGLGNLWKFPYMAGKNGGAAFILIYVGFMFCLCLPLMLSECVIGRRAREGAFDSFRKLAPRSGWSIIGVISVITAVLILSFYSVVGGWTVRYIVASFRAAFTGDGYGSAFGAFASSNFEPLLYHLIFLALTITVLWSGVRNGIERYSKILMPVLFLMVLFLAAYSITLPGAGKGIEFLLRPDFSSITSSVVLDALGQGLFSLSLGMAIMITYGSYLSNSENLPRMVVATISMDLIFALLAGFAILPAVFAFGFDPAEGAGLLFVILPEVFARVPAGAIIGPAFFVVIFIAAITSAVSLFEVIVAAVIRSVKLSRKKILLCIGAFLALSGTLCSVSLGLLSEFRIFGLNIFDLFDTLSSTYMMPAGAFLISLFVGYRMKRADVFDELSNGKTIKIRMFGLFMLLVKYFVPAGIVLIFLNKLGVF
ncbi:MAG: sodium-dependent transporter [Prevotellaceae bacterium]|jgi:NSS family neurotransmitter:Na+ symporter|nr:sodium-dependent transporter [Prevotellaceae bacterium]